MVVFIFGIPRLFMSHSIVPFTGQRGALELLQHVRHLRGCEIL